MSMAEVLAALPPVSLTLCRSVSEEEYQQALIRTPPPAPIKGKGMRFNRQTLTWNHTPGWYKKADIENM